LKNWRRWGVKSPRNQRVLEEEIQNHLGDALATAREREEGGFAKIGFEGVLSRLYIG
jgi:hypothetical protein